MWLLILRSRTTLHILDRLMLAPPSHSHPPESRYPLTHFYGNSLSPNSWSPIGPSLFVFVVDMDTIVIAGLLDCSSRFPLGYLVKQTGNQ